MLYLASCLASAYHGAPLAPHSRIITMLQVTEKAPAVAPVANGAAAAPAPKSSPPASKVDAKEPVVPLDEAIKAMIASKERVITAHNEDVDASLAYVSALIGKKFAPPGLATMDDVPGPNPDVFQVGGVPMMPGDAGWDPMRLSDSKTHLLMYREAEMKHGRLAMLGVAGWVASELLPHGADSILKETAGRAPSVLNGGLGSVPATFWLALLAVFSLVENSTFDYQVTGWQSEGKPWKYTPGDWAFDPLDLRSKCGEAWMKTVPESQANGLERVEMTVNAKKNVDIAEVWHGRAAMLAITGFSVQEALWGTPVVDQSPLFFATPVYHLLQEVIG